MEDTVKDASGSIFLHTCTVLSGGITVGDEVVAAVDRERRDDIKRNHTAAHLLQAALREVLGNHVQQAGQLVSDTVLRFDFTHFEAMTAKELLDVEQLVNEKIFEAIDVQTREMPIEEAKKMGAMALFGEKYGDVVRVVSAGDFSVEFCGGTHAENTARLGLFKIRQEGSVAAGVRRIEAVTGRGVLNYMNKAQSLIGRAAAALKLSSPKALVEGVQKAMEQIKDKQKEIDKLNSRIATSQMTSLMAESEEYNGFLFIKGLIKGLSVDVLREMCEEAIEEYPNIIGIVATINDGKINIAAYCGKDSVAHGAHAGKLAKIAAQAAGGNGGGKPTLAMAGAKDESKLEDAILLAVQAAKDMLH